MAQTENGAKKALCFYSNNKRPRIQEAQSTKSPVKIGRFNTSRGKIFMNREATVMLLDPNDASFEYNSSLAETAIVEIVELPRLAPGQLVNIRGQITKVGDVTSHLTFNNERIDKQEVLARDKTSNVKITLYGEDCNMVEEGNCYVMKNLRLKLVKNCVLLNSTKSNKFNASLTEPIIGLAESEEPVGETTIVAVICGVNNIKSYSVCPTCLKKNLKLDEDAKCQKCGCQFNPQHCATTFSLALSVKEVSSGEIFNLAFSNDRFQDLVREIDYKFVKLDEKDFVKQLFNITEPFTISFSVGSNTVKDIKLSVEAR